jgi:hypothetical protein
MTDQNHAMSLEDQIDLWRSYLRRRQAIHSVDVAELEDHLREQIATLNENGLAEDEAFLVAVKRMGNLDTLSREFAREHSDRLWKQLVVPSKQDQSGTWTSKEALMAFGLAIAAAIAIKLPALIGFPLDEDNAGFYLRNLGLFAFPMLTIYFSWKRQVDKAVIPWMIAGFILAAVFANIYPFVADGNTEILTFMHLPIALWLVVGIAYAGGRWGEMSGRMDFIRFSGELFIYFVLIALGGGALTGFMAMIFSSIGLDIEPVFESWLLPCGAMGGVVIASWLVEAKQSVIENMAPVLTRLFSPFFAAAILIFLGTLLLSGRVLDIERELLIAFDALLLIVLALLLYSISARDPNATPGPFDIVQLVLVISALLADAVALWAISARITELGFTPNRTAALGMNLILMVNLVWSAVLYLQFIQGRGSVTKLEHWQTSYLPIYSGWAAIVVIAFPPLFGYI